MGCWLWLSFRFEDGSFPGRERVQDRIRQLCEWLNTGLSNIQTTEELLTAEAAAAAARAASAAMGTTAASPAAAAAAAAAAGVIDSQNRSQSEGLAAGEREAAEDSGSSDVDEYSDAVFSMHVDEVPADAADRGYDGELLELDAAAAAGSAASDATAVAGSDEMGGAESELQSLQPESRTATSSAQGAKSLLASAATAAEEAKGGGGDSSDGDFKLTRAQLKKLKRLQAPYINWTAAVASGPVMATLSSSSSSSSTFTTDRGSMLEGFDGAKVDDLESLLMPEYEPNMARFVRWKLRPKFKVPPPPVPATAAQRQRSRQ